jgi:biotin transport system substrate-specific component
MTDLPPTERTSSGQALTGTLAPGRGLVLGLGIVAFIVGTAAGAYVAVPLPFTPVPVTLQPLFVILAGALLGPWAGATAMAGYLALGVGGAPVFSAGHAGLPWLLGPTGGYLIAYPAAAFLVGALAGRSRSTLRLAAAMAAGVAALYVGGVSQLWILTRQDPGALLVQGVLPFLAGDLVKILAALALVRAFRRTRPE